MDWMLFLAVCGLILTMIGMIAAAVWAVAQIKIKTSTLGSSIDSLAKVVEMSNSRLEKIDGHVQDIGKDVAKIDRRVVTLETKLDSRREEATR